MRCAKMHAGGCEEHVCVCRKQTESEMGLKDNRSAGLDRFGSGEPNRFSETHI